MDKRRIAIIGANEQQTPLILKAKEMGFETYVFAWHSGDDTGEQAADFFIPISTANKEAILAECRKINVCAVISIGSDMAAITAAYVAENMNLPTSSYKSICTAANKILTRKQLSKIGIAQPKYVEISDVIDKKALESLSYPIIIKPSDRSAGRGLKKLENQSGLYSAINYAREISIEHKAIAEEYIEGQVYSCECISQNGKHTVLGYTQRKTIEINGCICEYEHKQPASIALSVIKKMEQISREILESFNLLNGATSIEFIVKDGQIYIVEITPTMYGDFIGTDILPAVYGFDYLKMVIDIAIGSDINFTKKTDNHSASVHFVYKKEEGYSDAPDVPDGNRYGHYIKIKDVKEYGGVKPFYFSVYEPYYSENENTVILNSEYTAFWYALKDSQAKCVHIPYYISPSFAKIAGELDIECKYYHINRDFLPEDLNPGEADAVLLVNYFGLCHDFINNYDAKYKIIDNSTAFYQKPVLEEGVYNIYSCKKFFSVPDGAYLITKASGEIPLKRDVSYKRARALLMSLELGENSAYKEQQANEQDFYKERAKMSVLTEKIMASQDYQKERSNRIRNLKTLHSLLKDFNLLKLDVDNAVMQSYPLLVDADIREHLVNKKIYIPLMWRKFISDEFSGTQEKLFSEKLLCIPIDAHYTTEDMVYIGETIINLLT